MSARRLLPLAVAALFAFTMFNIAEPVSALPPASTGVESKVVPGGTAVVPSSWRYAWVDSTAVGCKAPSLIGAGIPLQGSAAAPAKGCPLGWDEIAGTSCKVSTTVSGDNSNWPTPCLTSCCTYAINWYGTTRYPSSWYLSENGFISFGPTGAWTCGATRNPVQLPTTTSASGCQSAASTTSHPINIVAGFWTNMRVPSSSAVGAGACWDTPAGPTADAGRIWAKGPVGSSPTRYTVIEFDRVLVNSNDAPCNPSPIPNHFATFQFKLWNDINAVDVIYQNVDHDGRPFSLGIQNTGTALSNAIGLNYCSPTTAGQCDAASPNISDRAVRYYQNVHAVMGPFHNPVAINEDCGAATTAPVGVTCPYAMPDSFYYDPDYQNPRTPATYCYQTAPTRGVLTGVPTCASGTWATGAYTPYLNYNGADSYQFRVREADGSISGFVTGSLTINPINDAPAGYTHDYDVISGDSRLVTATQGVLVEFPAGALNAATDPEAPPQRNTWACATVPPSGTSACTAPMTEGGPAQSLKAATSACPTYVAGPVSSGGWDPEHGDVKFTDFDGIVKPGVHPAGSFNYVADTYVGTDSFKFCVYDGVAYGAAATVNINLLAPTAGYTALSDELGLDEDAGPLVAEGFAAPAANDEASGCSSGLTYQLVPGSGPANAASFLWDSASGSFVYTPLPNYAGDDGFSYQMNCGGGPFGLSNVASVLIAVEAVNDVPVYDTSTYMSWGDIINEDNGVISSTPVPFARTVANFMTAIGPGGGADELIAQTIRPVIVSQSNTGLYSSTVPCPQNFDFALPVAACPSTLGPALELSGPVGNQVITLKYTTKPDANGVDKVCFRLMDDGGTSNGGQNQNTMPPTDPLCFNIKILPIADVPRPVADTYTIYQGHELYAPAPAVMFPGPVPAVYTVLQGNPDALTPDLEVDGETIKPFVSALPGYGKLWYLNIDGSFRYTPPAPYPRVVSGSPSMGTALSPLTTIGAEKFYDADGSGAFTSGDKMYLDVDASGTVTAKDVRLTWYNSFPAGSLVVAGDSDAGFTVADTAHTVSCYYDADANSAFTATDPIYVQIGACGLGGVTAGTLRAAEGAGGFGGTLVAAGDADAGRATTAVTTAYCYQEKDSVAGFSAGDWVFLDMGACGTISVGDVLMTWGTQTFTYFVQDSSGSNSPAVPVTVRIRGNAVPVATATVSTTQARVGDPVSLFASCTDADSDDQPGLVKYWDLGDGFTTTSASPLHAFEAPGVYVVTFYCYDAHGDVSIVTHSITVSAIQNDVPPGEEPIVEPDPGPGTAPLAAFAGEDQIVQEGTPVALLGTGSGDVKTWKWTQTSGAPTVQLADADKAKATFAAPMLTSGVAIDLVFALVVGDGTATSVADTVKVSVVSANEPPVVRIAVPTTAHEGDVVTLDASATSDGNGDALTYKWAVLSGPAVELSGANMAIASFTVPDGSLGRSFVVAVEVSDGKANMVDSVPVLVTAKVFTGPGFSAEVADGGVVTVTPLVEAVNYVWDFGDQTDPVASTGTISHTYATHGDYTIRLTAQEADGAVLSFQQGVPIAEEKSIHDASRPGESGDDHTAAYAAWFLAGGAVVLLAGIVGLAIFVRRRSA